MELKVASKKQNQLFNRTEVVVLITDYASTPSRKETEALLLAEFKCASDCLVINEIHQPFGTKQVKVNAFIYDSAEKAKAMERPYKFKRGKPAPAPASSG